jgi:hypothetical protein
MSRNVWLKFDEWELINEELSELKWHSFQLSKSQVNKWRKDMERYPSTSFDSYKFERVSIYGLIEKLQNPKIVNVLCRENWRPQDMHSTMNDIHDFIGFILAHCKNVNMNTTLDEWENVRNEMNKVIQDSDKRIWWDNELIELYHSLSDTLSS